MEKFRILIVDDSAFMRAIIRDLILKDPAFEVAGTAATGKEALEAARLLAPDAMTMDLEMPEMNGLEALVAVMESRPLPVIMFSGISEEHTSLTIAALQQGAFDFIRKPSPASPPGEIETIGRLLREKLHTALQFRGRLIHPRLPAREAAGKKELPARKQAGEAAGQAKPASAPGPRSAAREMPGETRKTRIPPVADAKRRSASPSEAPLSKERAARPASGASRPAKTGPASIPPVSAEESAHKSLASREKWTQIVAIGTSTGGPRALSEVIGSLPASLPAPVLVVQHMPPRFTASLAKRLEAGSMIEVTEAEQGERVLAGRVYIAPGGSHMELEKDGSGYRIRLTQSPAVSGHRPSVDVLFRSIVPYAELERHCVLLTGMGSDGAKGMLELRESGAASTITESEETCVVYGMPRSAVELGGSQTVLPLFQIAGELARRCR
ncbi:protein-glutamate methylesterase/protein-glutamine glutaminase [Paenibacillus humicus]|nr:chemotaxis response regulator protein-glutamate methylesterase [Paenibacillus humicus]